MEKYIIKMNRNDEREIEKGNFRNSEIESAIRSGEMHIKSGYEKIKIVGDLSGFTVEYLVH
jgi:hypothetical protein